MNASSSSFAAASLFRLRVWANIFSAMRYYSGFFWLPKDAYAKRTVGFFSPLPSGWLVSLRTRMNGPFAAPSPSPSPSAQDRNVHLSNTCPMKKRREENPTF